MAIVESTVNSVPAKNSRKVISNLIVEKLSVSLADYRSLIGEARFDNRIRKTAKKLGGDFAKKLPKKSKKNKQEPLAKV